MSKKQESFDPVKKPGPKKLGSKINIPINRSKTIGLPTPQPVNNVNSGKDFEEIRRKDLVSGQKHLDNYASSSEDDDDVSVDFIAERKSMVGNIFKGYDGDRSDLIKTQQFLENLFESSAATCVICIATVRTSHPIWSCGSCFTFFHLGCIQRWANDSTSQKKLNQTDALRVTGYYTNQGVYVPPTKDSIIRWDCPNCRAEYSIVDIPRDYRCFCGKEVNPERSQWTMPHSCGQHCERPLKPYCGHTCKLLCHPGPCPPCPQYIQSNCLCKQSTIKMVRCSQKDWRCQQKCKQMLACGIHVCGQLCHPVDQCPPCGRRSKQKCLCGAAQQERFCTDLVWQCERICNKPYSCKLHKCQLRCHEGDCGECPLGLPRSCPCGKRKSQAKCSEDVGLCGDTCHKMLPCGVHLCAERCHKGECGPCLEMIEKKCRCGQHTKLYPCSRLFTCETKCKQMRDCKKHPCNRKCCNGTDCLPCDKICSKVLSCGKHKCTSLCHRGPCYPCRDRATVKCRCGQTTITVPCGREKRTNPPKCLQPCKIPSKCHHTNPHRCHSSKCPTCHQICNLPNDTTNCNHLCSKLCHDAVDVTIVDKNFVPAGPWERPSIRCEVKKLAHPPCDVTVPVTCVGGHETIDWPCWDSVPRKCGRPCGRQLKCGNHTCELECHSVQDLTSLKADPSCSECNETCSRKRPSGCLHPCQRECHPDPCKECEAILKGPCHCGMTTVYYKCNHFNSDKDEVELGYIRTKLLSCGNRCIKNYACGHQCIEKCHPGECPNPKSCKKKVKIYCKCKTRKMDVTCDRIRSGFTIECEEICKKKLAEMEAVAEAAKRKQEAEEEVKNRRELEEFERKFGPKKHKERKRNVEELEEQDKFIYWLIGFGILTVLFGFFMYFYLL